MGLLPGIFSDIVSHMKVNGAGGQSYAPKCDRICQDKALMTGLLLRNFSSLFGRGRNNRRVSVDLYGGCIGVIVCTRRLVTLDLRSLLARGARHHYEGPMLSSSALRRPFAAIAVAG